MERNERLYTQEREIYIIQRIVIQELAVRHQLTLHDYTNNSA